MATFTHPDQAPEGHEWVTRDGKKVRIYATDHAGGWPISGAIFVDTGWVAYHWTNDGIFSPDYADEYDIIDKPKPVVRWAYAYNGFVSSSHETKADVQDRPRLSIALYRFEWPDGDMTKAPIVTVEDTDE